MQCLHIVAGAPYLSPCLAADDAHYSSQVWDFALQCYLPNVADGTNVGKYVAGCFSQFITTSTGRHQCLDAGRGTANVKASVPDCLQDTGRQQWLVSDAGDGSVYLMTLAHGFM
jgi:hypothetical protein